MVARVYLCMIDGNDSMGGPDPEYQSMYTKIWNEAIASQAILMSQRFYSLDTNIGSTMGT